MPMATSYAELRALSTEDLVAQYDRTAKETVVGLNFLSEEIARRSAEAQTAAIIRMTEHMRNMTIVITLLTVLNVALAAYLVYK